MGMAARNAGLSCVNASKTIKGPRSMMLAYYRGSQGKTIDKASGKGQVVAHNGCNPVI